jgi:2-keto-4-pentenoate hydratase/2-oxohepta-3-ene-1,7-dioic acid hydratase in catechol pathway
MHLVTLRLPGRQSAGALIGSEVLDFVGATDAVPAARLLPTSVRALIESGDEALNLARHVVDEVANKKAIADRLRQSWALVPREKANLAAPIADTGFILSCGINYHEHIKEMKGEVPKTPVAFAKSVGAIIGPGQAIKLPPANPNMVDWEGEFCAVIGRPCHAVKEADALDYVAGYTLVNDVSARDWVAPIFKATGTMGPIMAWEHNILGKQFPTFCPMGPAVVTKDEIPDPNSVALTTRLNGKVMQSANTDDLVFNVAQLIAYYSQFFLLRPGDVITTGSPAGVGYGRDPKVFMRAGDRIEVQAKGIGILSNPVAA